MNGFERHNIKHSSPSALNMWSSCPAAWAARYLFDKQFKFGIAPQIGILVEEVCANVLTKTMELEAALKLAHDKFNRNNALNTSAKDLSRIKDIESMSVLALEKLEEFGEPEFINQITGRKQQKIELMCNGAGWKLPVIGYLDFVYPKHGLVVDLKTTLRMPTNMSDEHKRQAAIYGKAAGNRHVRFLYVTPKKAQFHDLEGGDEILQSVKVILNRQEKMLALHDAETLRQILPVNLQSFFWNGSEHIAKELYSV